MATGLDWAGGAPARGQGRMSRRDASSSLSCRDGRARSPAPCARTHSWGAAQLGPGPPQARPARSSNVCARWPRAPGAARGSDRGYPRCAGGFTPSLTGTVRRRPAFPLPPADKSPKRTQPAVAAGDHSGRGRAPHEATRIDTERERERAKTSTTPSSPRGTGAQPAGGCSSPITTPLASPTKWSLSEHGPAPRTRAPPPSRWGSAPPARGSAPEYKAWLGRRGRALGPGGAKPVPSGCLPACLGLGQSSRPTGPGRVVQAGGPSAVSPRVRASSPGRPPLLRIPLPGWLSGNEGWLGRGGGSSRGVPGILACSLQAQMGFGLEPRAPCPGSPDSAPRVPHFFAAAGDTWGSGSVPARWSLQLLRGCWLPAVTRPGHSRVPPPPPRRVCRQTRWAPGGTDKWVGWLRSPQNQTRKGPFTEPNAQTSLCTLSVGVHPCVFFPPGWFSCAK